MPGGIVNTGCQRQNCQIRKFRVFSVFRIFLTTEHAEYTEFSYSIKDGPKAISRPFLFEDEPLDFDSGVVAEIDQQAKLKTGGVQVVEDLFPVLVNQFLARF